MGKLKTDILIEMGNKFKKVVSGKFKDGKESDIIKKPRNK